MRDGKAANSRSICPSTCETQSRYASGSASAAGLAFEDRLPGRIIQRQGRGGREDPPSFDWRERLVLGQAGRSSKPILQARLAGCQGLLALPGSKQCYRGLLELLVGHEGEAG